MHIKYRPRTLEEVAGNYHLKASIAGLKYDRPFLFHGDRGCGKTTLAYIIAREFGANPENILDVNCVHYSGVNDIRKELEDLSKTSLFGNKKVLILDEVHELSKKAQQVLLKPLEMEFEDGHKRQVTTRTPLKDVLIICCTTEPEGVVPTLFDRCNDYKVLPLSEVDSIALVNSICKKEDIILSKNILSILITKSEGNPRRLLKGLGKIKNITDVKDVESLLDIVELDGAGDALELIKAFLSLKDWYPFSARLKEILKTNKPEALRVGMMNLIATRFLSKWEVNMKLAKAYDYLVDAEGYPEKANFIMALYKGFMEINK